MQTTQWVGLPVDRQPRRSCQGVQHGTQVDDSQLVCMWDGATRRGSHSAGGMVLCGQGRSVLRAKGVQFARIDEPMVVELLVLREAITWCLEWGLSEVRFEGDAKVIIDKINQADSRDNHLGAVLEEICQHFDAHPGFSVRFVGRDNNRVAHSVARKALSLYPSGNRLFDFRAWLLSRM
ncbi:unnamed protein product [Linum trigynum]|uniref:RNase H type-1 domain-containing protein n=1 Tax=Linum trigynum TaxID=586398 RepID=A0AAV2D158_9ROSI